MADKILRSIKFPDLPDTYINPVLDAFPTATLTDQPVASFADGAEGIPAKDLAIDINLVQSGSGDPAPDNVRPISGWTGMTIKKNGKNQIPFNAPIPSTAKYVEATVDGVNVRVKNTQASNYANCNFRPAIIYSTYKAGVKLTMSADIVIHSGAASMGIRSGSANTFVSGSLTNITTDGHYSCTITTLDEQCYASLLCTYSTSELGDVEFNNFQLEVGEAETAVEPYASQTITVSWNTEAGTVYGGTLDVTTGVLSVTHIMITRDGTQSIYAASISQRTDTTRFAIYTGASDATRCPNPTSVDLSLAVCNRIPSVASVYNNDILGLYIPKNQNAETYAASGGVIYISIPSAAGNTADSIKAWLAENPLTIVYKLDVPTTYQLTPKEVKTLLGANNIWADTGDVNSLTYRADPTLYINGKVAALTALMSES